MAEQAEHDQLRRELQDVEAQIAQVRSDIEGIREQVGGQGSGAQDSEDVAAALTNAEEQEAVLGTLEQRRETVLKQLGEAG
jgi:outer membrane murein-binding lipoprotein Lpp